jgi:hypothetical protein
MMFCCENQLIFRITVGGRPKLVEFSEAQPGVSSKFMTDDEAVIESLRKHRFYRSGKIWEFETPKPKQVVQQDATIMEFAGYSQLKAYLKKTYGDEAKSVKTPEQVKKFAENKGVLFRFSES